MGELFDQVCSLSTLMDAWRRVKSKKAQGGLDQITVQDFERDFNRSFERLKKTLKDRTYTPEPVERVNAPKQDYSGETRPLSLPSVKDKVVQQAVRSVIEPLFNTIFMDCSYAYRPGKGPQKAFKRVNHYLTTENKRWVALADFDRFFDTLDQGFLLRQLSRLINDPDIIRLIRMWLRSGYVNSKGDYFDIDSGVGQGSVISPLLSNIYVHPLDEYMTQKGHAYLRYSDNLIILGYSRENAFEALGDLKSFIHDVLELRLNKSPYPVKSIEKGFVFLGIYYRNDKRAISMSKMQKIKDKISYVISPGKAPDTLIEKLNRTLDGTGRYYGVIKPEPQFIEIDEHLALRLTLILAEYIKRNRYRRVDELVAYLTPLVFLSDSYRRERDKKIRSIAGMALKKCIIKRDGQEGIKQLKGGLKEGIKAADRAVSTRKRKYLTDQSLISEVVVSTHGAFLGKKGNRLVVKMHKKNLLSRHLHKIKNIIVATRGVSLSSDLIQECARQKIAIHFLERYGPPYAMVYAPSHPRSNLGILQLEVRQNGQGLQIAARIVAGKIKNQLNLTKFYARSRKNNSDFQEGLESMESEIDRLTDEINGCPHGEDYDIQCNKLFLIEGRAALVYWGMVKKLLADDVEFPGRKRKGAKDTVNSLLNYGYGILYARVWQAVVLAGLNPCISFLHAPQRDKPTLAFDLIEEFRCQAVNRAVFTMITRGETLELDKKSSLLTESTRKKLIENVIERLSSLVPYKGKRIQLDDVVRLQARHLATCLEKAKIYRPFIGRY